MDTTTLLPHIKLRFNIDHPSYEECYLFGYECGLSDVSEEDNPFKAHSKEAEQWIEGWWAGAYGEDPLFDNNFQELLETVLLSTFETINPPIRKFT